MSKRRWGVGRMALGVKRGTRNSKVNAKAERRKGERKGEEAKKKHCDEVTKGQRDEGKPENEVHNTESPKVNAKAERRKGKH